MARDRKDLGMIYRQILGNDNVYFSPPSSKQMKYPCIKYDLSDMSAVYADNRLYNLMYRYEVVLITHMADNSDLLEKILSLPFTRLDRTYYVEGLHHYVFTVYY